MNNQADFSVKDHGSIFLLTPLSSLAEDWISEHLDPEHMTFGGAVVVEHRFIRDIVAGFQHDGLTLTF